MISVVVFWTDNKQSPLIVLLTVSVYLWHYVLLYPWAIFCLPWGTDNGLQSVTEQDSFFLIVCSSILLWVKVESNWSWQCIANMSSNISKIYNGIRFVPKQAFATYQILYSWIYLWYLLHCCHNRISSININSWVYVQFAALHGSETQDFEVKMIDNASLIFPCCPLETCFSLCPFNPAHLEVHCSRCGAVFLLNTLWIA